MTGIAEIVLSVFDNKGMGLKKAELCNDGHFSPKMFTPEKLLCMRSDTLMRLLLYLATTMSEAALPIPALRPRSTRSTSC